MMLLLLVDDEDDNESCNDTEEELDDVLELDLSCCDDVGCVLLCPTTTTVAVGSVDCFFHMFLLYRRDLCINASRPSNSIQKSKVKT